jgi:hypothetical protein
MITSRRPKHLLLIATSAVVAAGIAAPIASADDYSGPSPASGAGALAPSTATVSSRSLPNGKTDVIKVMGNTKGWGDVPQQK